MPEKLQAFNKLGNDNNYFHMWTHSLYLQHCMNYVSVVAMQSDKRIAAMSTIACMSQSESRYSS